MFLKKLKVELAYDWTHATPGHIPGENHNLKRHMHPSVHCSTIYNSQDMEVTKMPINREVDKDVVHIYSRTLLSHKKEWNCVNYRDVDGPRDCHLERSQKEKKNHLLTHICRIYKNCIYEFICKAQIETLIQGTNVWMQRRKRWGWDGLGDWEWYIYTSMY